MLDRAQNWWREARVRDDGSSLLRVNGLFGSSQFGSPSHSYPIPVKFGPDGSLYLATWDYDCCRAQLPASQPGRLMRIDFIGDQVDTTAPVVEPAVTRRAEPVRRLPRPRDARRQRDRQLRHLAHRVLARRHGVDPLHGARRLHRRAAPTPCASGPRTGRTTRPRSSRSTFTVVAGAACLPARSDEFNGALNTALWSYRHSTTPATGAKAPSVAERQPRAAARRVTRST